jgi:ubiquinol-cytochrome c reductase cytochrome b subunit
LANPLVTPTHIQPEWYFLFAYAILRSIPNKLGGVLALLASILVFFLFPFKTFTYSNRAGLSSSYFRFRFWIFICCFVLLTWLGIMPAEYPFTLVSALITVIYFILVGTLLCF